ncbi:helix-turn-helix domain-containing protein [Herbidospora sp. NEAU-GS84]|uniref:Helix-turn-helix domain-containing protein n=1 Tax=Herbidospora solisilvae TaxID=2696284 RepID=A0A7C9JCS5_9ACTN|nr:helix-turn-helix domain-containing protein [Herbidospora solisilvae]NAS23864.1 helix-turn-helix domain-containing protein [Herbidospora solisilvae]
MPGGRLSQQERQQIAAGLADGLAYAEIARGLGRPTSTVTREVMRNGGPTAYRAEMAHRATERRAHRRRRSPAGAPAAAPDAYGRDPEAVRDFEEAFTTSFVESGLPRMMSRILACLYVSDSGGMTAAELVRRLQVSPASVSKSIAFLEGRALVRRERRDDRRERYVVDLDLWYQSMLASARANDRVVVAARQGVEVMGRDTPAGQRLESVARFMDHVTNDLIRSTLQWRPILFPDNAGKLSDGVE